MNKKQQAAQFNQTTKSPGPPIKNRQLSSLRTKIWFRAIAKESNMSFDMLAKEFGDEERKWRRYMKGENEPKEALLNQVEAKFPGTKRWITVCRLLEEELLTEIITFIEESTGELEDLVRLLAGLKTHPVIGELIPDICKYAELIYPSEKWNNTIQIKSPQKNNCASKHIEPHEKGANEENDSKSLEAMLWCRAVVVGSGLNISELEKKFPYHDATRNKSSISWKRFAIGKSKPSVELVDIVERSFPDTKWWFEIPLSRLLDSRRFEISELKEVFNNIFIASLPEEFEEDGVPLPRALAIMASDCDKEDYRFWRLNHEDSESVFDELFEVDNVTTDFGKICLLIGIFALIRESEITHDQHQHIYGFRTWCRFAIYLVKHPWFGEIFNWKLPPPNTSTLIQEIHEKYVMPLYKENSYYILEDVEDNDDDCDGKNRVSFNTVKQRRNALEYVNAAFRESTELHQLFMEKKYRLD